MLIELVILLNRLVWFIYLLRQALMVGQSGPLHACKSWIFSLG